MPPAVLAVSLLPTNYWIGLAIGLFALVAVAIVGWMLVQRGHDKAQAAKLAAGPDPFTQGSTRERRVAPRRRGNPVAILVSDAAAEVPPVRGWIMDRSASGLGLELEEEGEVDIGTVLAVRPLEATDAVPWIRVEVRNRQLVGSNWRLGCQFLKPPAWDVMMRFG